MWIPHFWDGEGHTPAVPKSKRDAIKSVECLANSLADARQALRAAEVSLRRALRQVDKKDVDLATAIIAANPSQARQSINDALATLEKRRHDTRATCFELALDQGMSIGEIARLWGISRQLAHRYINEARGED